MANDIITNLHPDNDPNTNLYPNIKKENIPNKAIDYNRLDDDVRTLINSIVSLNPQVDTSTNILAFKENKGIYVGSDTGEWYYWNGTQYVSGGIYQAIQLNDGSVTYRKTNFVTSVINSRNIYNKNDPDIYVGTSGSINGCWLINTTTGAVERNQWQMDGAYSVSYLIPVEPSTQYVFSDNGNTTSFYSVAFYDTNGNFISKANDWSSSITTPSNCYYIRINNQSLKTSNYQIEKGATITSYVEYNDKYYIDKLKINNNNLDDDSVSAIKTDFMKKKTGKNIYNDQNPNIYIGTSGSPNDCWLINSTTGVVERNQYQMDGAYSVSYLIPVESNTTYYYSQNSELHTIYKTAFYDVNGDFISMANNYSSQITTPSNCYFIRINNQGITSGGNYQIEKNSRSSYEPYEEYYIISGLKINEEDVINRSDLKLSTPLIFNSIGVIGDSYSLGQTYKNDGTYNTTNHRYSWFRQIAYKYNIIPNSYAIGGINTRTWLSNQYGLSKLLSDEASDCYLLALGINDVYNLGHDYLGSITDIKNDYTQNADTFYGNYGKIISNILINKPNAKIIMLTITSNSDECTDFNNAIIEIANHFNIPYGVTMDDEFFSSDCFTRKIGGHPTCVGYSGMGEAYDRVISKCITNNIDYFKTLNID